MTTLSQQLRQMTIVVADTGDIEAIEQYKPRDATTNPSLITAAAQMPQYAELIDDALRFARKERGAAASNAAVVALAIDRLAIEFGLRIQRIIEGRVSTEVDARLSYDTDKTIAKARELIAMYEAAGSTRERVLIKIASTWEGIRAAELLEREGIHCNLTLLFGLHQAVACAEAKVTLISPFVGRILDWYLKDTGRTSYPAAEDPGVASVTEIYAYYKRHGHPTEIMGASFRNLGQITELAGCDLLTIAPKFLKVLEETEGELPRKLDPKTASEQGVDRITMDRATFDKMHAADRMATDKLADGITGFSKSLEALEVMLEKRLGELS
ncbi:MAG: transaldolase [Kofleriaceae bacterium]|nr:transaldolase [Kofleriaceae bacterium]